jgi:hypothetical protein
MLFLLQQACICDPSLSDKFEFSFLNANLMVLPNRQPIFGEAAKGCAP